MRRIRVRRAALLACIGITSIVVSVARGEPPGAVGAAPVDLAATPTPTPSPVLREREAPTGDDCAGCTLLGSLSVAGPILDPEQPAVGELLTMRFPVAYRLPGGFDCGPSGSCAFEGGGPYLAGGDAPVFAPDSGEVVVRRRVAREGTTTIQLVVSAMTEEQCCSPESSVQPSDCSCYFQYARIDASSPVVEVHLSDGQAGPDDDGCQIAGERGELPGWWVLGGLVLLLAPASRRSEVARRLVVDATHRHRTTRR